MHFWNLNALTCDSSSQKEEVSVPEESQGSVTILPCMWALGARSHSRRPQSTLAQALQDVRPARPTPGFARSGHMLFVGITCHRNSVTVHTPVHQTTSKSKPFIFWYSLIFKGIYHVLLLGLLLAHSFWLSSTKPIFLYTLYPILRIRPQMCTRRTHNKIYPGVLPRKKRFYMKCPRRGCNVCKD